MTASDDLKARTVASVEQFNDPELRDEYLLNYAPDVILHGFPPGLPPGRDGAQAFYAMIWSAFPDCRVEIEDMAEEGDRVAARYRFSGTHLGEFSGVPASGNRFETQGMTIIRFADGLYAERWNALDMMSLLQQIGAIAPGN